MRILVLNAGSSSLKFALFDGGARQVHGQIDRLGVESAGARFQAHDEQGQTLASAPLTAAAHEEAVRSLLEWLAGRGRPIEAIGHRVVHGGDRLTAPARVTADNLSYLESLTPLAPLHQPHSLNPIRLLSRLHPDLPQVACFDTAFHATQERLERMYALPRSYFDKGVKKYGFHGLSYEYIASRLPEVDARAAQGKTVVLHLGAGASMCAMHACRSVASTMGFTALEGLVMATRTGSIDPGVLLYLLQEEHMGPGELAELLYRRSGLLGVSGVSLDMRDLLASPAPAAREAVDLFCRRAARELGALAAVLGGLDALIFTAGIGEHAAPVRDAICRRAAWLGVRLDPEANRAGQPQLHAAESSVHIWIIPTNEELMIARHVERLAGV